MDMYNSGAIASVLDQQKVRMHTDGYKAILTSFFAADLSTYATAVTFFNCIGKKDDVQTTPGAYCLKASSAAAGVEELMEFHWVPQTSMAVVATAPTISATTTGLLRYATQL